jgi:chromosomal replication initiator protein
LITGEKCGLTHELEAIASLPRSASPALVGLARRSLTALSRIQHSATLVDISRHIERDFHLMPSALQSKARDQRTAFARHLSMYLCRKVTGAPFESIGQHFNRDHSTAVYAFNRIQRRMTSDAAFRSCIEKIEARITDTATITARAA